MVAPFLGVASFGQLFESGEYSDFKLVCQGKEFKVHKVVVCTRSSVLTAAIRGPFQESQTGVINIEEFDAATVGHMLEFLYTGNYDLIPQPNEVTPVPGPSSPDSPMSEWFTTLPQSDPREPDNDSQPNQSPINNGVLHHVRVCAIADYYDIQSLAELAHSKMRGVSSGGLKAGVLLAAAKESVSTTNDEALHEIMATLVAQNLERLVTIDRLEDVMGNFSAKVLRKYVQEVEALKAKLCDKTTELENSAAREKRTADGLEGTISRSNRMQENIDRMIETLERTETCRNPRYSAEFHCNIERSGYDPTSKLTLRTRCGKCRCRH